MPASLRTSPASPSRARPTRAGLLAVAATGTLATGAMSPASAEPVFRPAAVQIHGYAGVWEGDCTASTVPAAAPAGPEQPLVENGPAVRSTAEVTGTVTSLSDPGDQVTETAQLDATTTLTSAGGLPRALTATFTGSVEATSTKPTSACRIVAHARSRTEVGFTLSRPMWVTLARTTRGPAYAETYVYAGDGGESYEDQYGMGLDGSASATYLLPPGDYSAYLDVAAQKGGWSGFARTPLSGSASVRFAAAGAARTAPAGDGLAFVSLPATRDCALHTATGTVTHSARRADRVRSVTLRVDGRAAGTLRGTRVAPGARLTAHLADARAATLTAVVVLKDGSRRAVTARYLPCTA